MNIKKAAKMNKVHYDIRGPVSILADEMLRSGIDVVKLNTGNPGIFGFETPQYIVDSINEHINISSAYSSSKGMLEAREAVVKYCTKIGINNLDCDDIYTGNGVSELIGMTMQALLNDGDEVLIPCPEYPLWTASVLLSGGTPVHYICDESSSWYPDLNDIKSKVTSKTKAIVVINPNNPTGAVYPRELLEGIAKIASENNLLILSDEIYDRLLMDGLEHIPMGSLTDAPVLTYNGLSKSHQVCGYRCGFMAFSGGKEGTLDFRNGLDVIASLRLCSNVIAQSVLKVSLEDYNFSDPYLVKGGRLYEQREISYNMLNNIHGISVVKSQAGLYMFPKIDTNKLKIYDDDKFVLDFLKEKHVLLTHGGAYNWTKPDHFRLVYLPEVEVLKDVLERLSDFLDVYHQ